MNNMQFDEATQTYGGTVGPYRWNGEEQGQPFTVAAMQMLVVES